MKEIVFKKAKENHFYAERNDKNQLIQIREPIKGNKYYEFAVVSGGSK